MMVRKVTGLCSCSLKALIFDIEPACIELFPPLSLLPFCLLSLSPLTFLSLTLMTASARASRLVQLFCSSLCLVCMYSSWCYWRGRAWNISLHWFTPIVKCLWVGCCRCCDFCDFLQALWVPVCKGTFQLVFLSSGVPLWFSCCSFHSSQGLTPCLSLGYYCWDQTPWPKHGHGQKKGIFWITFPYHCSSSKDVMTGTQTG